MNSNDLTELQKTILRMHACGGRVKDIANAAETTTHKIQHNIRAIYKTLDVKSVPQAIAKLSGFTI